MNLETNHMGDGFSSQYVLASRSSRCVEVVRSNEDELSVRALLPDGLPDATAEGCRLPPVPAHILEYGAAFLRHVWRVHHACALWWLYLDPRRSRWWAY